MPIVVFSVCLLDIVQVDPEAALASIQHEKNLIPVLLKQLLKDPNTIGDHIVLKIQLVRHYCAVQLEFCEMWGRGAGIGSVFEKVACCSSETSTTFSGVFGAFASNALLIWP